MEKNITGNILAFFYFYRISVFVFLDPGLMTLPGSGSENFLLLLFDITNIS